MLQRNSPELAAVKIEKQDIPEESNKEGDKDIREANSGISKTVEAEENTSSVIENGENNKMGLEDGELRSISKIKNNSCTHDDKLVPGCDKPPKKKFRGCEEKFTLLITNAPLSTEPEAIKQALEKVIGIGKVSIVGHSWKLQPAFQTFINIFYVEVFDRETLKFLVELKPKLCISNQELTIEVNKAIRAKVRRKEARMVFISQIPINACDETIIRTALEAKVRKGNVISVICLKSRKTKYPTGRATVYCANELTAKRLLLLDSKIKIYGRKISIVKYKSFDMRRKNEPANEVMKLSFSNLPVPLKDERFRYKILKLVGTVDFLEIELPLVKKRIEAQNCTYIVNLTEKEVVSKLVDLHKKVSLGGKYMNIRIHLEDDLYSSKQSSVQGRRTNSGCHSGSGSVISQDGRIIIDYGVGWEQSAHKSINGAYGNVQGSTHGIFNGADYHNDGSFGQKTPKIAHVSSDWDRQAHDNIYEKWRPKTCECAFTSVHQVQNHQGTDNVSRVSQRPRTHENVSYGKNHPYHENFSEFGSHENDCDNNSYHYNFSEDDFVNLGQNYQSFENCGTGAWRHTAHEGVQRSDLNSNFCNHCSLSRVDLRQRTYENVNDIIGHGNVNQEWNHQSHDNPISSGRLRANQSINFSTVCHDDCNYRSHGNVNRIVQRQRGVGSVHGMNNLENVYQSTWEHQGNCDWSSGFQYEEGHHFNQ